MHVNRTLQELRRQGLIALEGRRLRVPDLAALQDAALFNPSYLHLDRDGRRPGASEPAPGPASHGGAAPAPSDGAA